MKQYQDLLKHILENGTRHEDRTGVGTISVFGYQTQFDLHSFFSDCDDQASSVSLGCQKLILIFQK